ncbi:MAG: EAL domain-containing protein [Pseudomonadota bacterium]
MRAEAFHLTNADIDHAFEHGHFTIVLQPIFDLRTGRARRSEAFVRWAHPSLGLLPPGVFVSFLESQGRIGELTRHVLRNALAERARLTNAGLAGDLARISVNLSALDLCEPAFPAQLQILLREAHCPPDALTLECEPPSDQTSAEDYLYRLELVRETGVALALETRGRPVASLRRLTPFPFTEIKAGGQAILRFAKMARGPGLAAIAELIDFAANHDVETTAVGVEDKPSLRALSNLGFTMAQGNLLAPPTAPGALSALQPHKIHDLLADEARASDAYRRSFGAAGLNAETAAISAIDRSEDAFEASLRRHLRESDAFAPQSSLFNASGLDVMPHPSATETPLIRDRQGDDPHQRWRKDLTDAFEVTTLNDNTDLAAEQGGYREPTFSEEAEAAGLTEPLWSDGEVDESLAIPTPPAEPLVAARQASGYPRRARAQGWRRRWRIQGFWPKDWRRWWWNPAESSF